MFKIYEVHVSSNCIELIMRKLVSKNQRYDLRKQALI